jgi:succinate dehydrogenase/fumarate reductase iron-sulfur protein
MCGSCAIVINGKEGLACQTTIASLGGRTIRLEPLRALPVLRDLTVDLTPFFRAATVAEAVMRPSSPRLREVRRLPPGEPRRALIERQSGCITCGACFSACELSATRKNFLGPAALNRLLMLALDERDLLGKKRLETAACDRGALRCHTMGNCSAVCPVDIPLREGMQRLKGLIAAGKW